MKYHLGLVDGRYLLGIVTQDSFEPGLAIPVIRDASGREVLFPEENFSVPTKVTRAEIQRILGFSHAHFEGYVSFRDFHVVVSKDDIDKRTLAPAAGPVAYYFVLAQFKDNGTPYVFGGTKSDW